MLPKIRQWGAGAEVYPGGFSRREIEQHRGLDSILIGQRLEEAPNGGITAGKTTVADQGPGMVVPSKPSAAQDSTLSRKGSTKDGVVSFGPADKVAASSASSGRARPGSSQPRDVASRRSSPALRRPTRPARVRSRSESPDRMRKKPHQLPSTVQGLTTQWLARPSGTGFAPARICDLARPHYGSSLPKVRQTAST